MTTVSDLLARKGGEVYTVAPTTTVLEATQRMNEHRVGAMAVLRDGCLVGMFTERDVLRRVVAEQRSPSQTRVGDVMTGDVICCGPDTTVEQVSRIMKDRRVRHLPVCDGNGRLAGLISIGDVNAFHARDQEETINLLNELFCAR